MKRWQNASVAFKRWPKENLYLLKGTILLKHYVFLFKTYMDPLAGFLSLTSVFEHRFQSSCHYYFSRSSIIMVFLLLQGCICKIYKAFAPPINLRRRFFLSLWSLLWLNIDVSSRMVLCAQDLNVFPPSY